MRQTTCDHATAITCSTLVYVYITMLVAINNNYMDNWPWGKTVMRKLSWLTNNYIG